MKLIKLSLSNNSPSAIVEGYFGNVGDTLKEVSKSVVDTSDLPRWSIGGVGEDDDFFGLEEFDGMQATKNEDGCVSRLFFTNVVEKLGLAIDLSPMNYTIPDLVYSLRWVELGYVLAYCSEYLSSPTIRDYEIRGVRVGVLQEIDNIDKKSIEYNIDKYIGSQTKEALFEDIKIGKRLLPLPLYLGYRALEEFFESNNIPIGTFMGEVSRKKLMQIAKKLRGIK